MNPLDKYTNKLNACPNCGKSNSAWDDGLCGTCEQARREWDENMKKIEQEEYCKKHGGYFDRDGHWREGE